MKIGILTLHNALNFGAYLQAYALQQVLLLWGHEVYIADQCARRLFEQLLQVKCKYPKRMVYNIRFFKEFSRVRGKLRIAPDPLDSCDAVVVGSDELWNLENSGFIHREEYFGRGIDCAKIISYAVSGNRMDADKLKRIMGEAASFERFSDISVRDENTCKMVYKIEGKRPTLVLDPTMLYTGWERDLVPCRKSNYILVYNFTTEEQEKRAILRFARERKKKIISVGSYNTWCDENLVATPFEFLGFMQGADYVVTSSFHGVAFSIMLHKNFVIYPQKKGKVLDIMQRFMLKERDATDAERLEDLFDAEIEWESVHRIWKGEAKKSIEWLKNAVEK